MRWLLPWLAAGGLAAATAEEVVAAVEAGLDPEAAAEPGSPLRAAALAAALGGSGLVGEQALALQLAVGEAWLDARDPVRSASAALVVCRDGACTTALRERAGLLLVAAWQLEAQAEAGPIRDLGEELARLGGFEPRLLARAEGAQAERLIRLRDAAALGHLDRALALLAPGLVEERVPFYALRITAMEELGQDAAAVQAWLLGRQDDPAARQVMEAALTGSQRMLGRPAPAIAGRRLDRPGDGPDPAAWRGSPVLVQFLASWCEPCASLAPVVAEAARRYGGRLMMVGVSLDSAATLPRLPGFLAQHGIAWPVYGDGQGWDSENDDAWQVDGLPALVLLAPDGTVAATDLVGRGGDDCAARIEAALAPFLGPAPVSATAPRPQPEEMP